MVTHLQAEPEPKACKACRARVKWCQKINKSGISCYGIGLQYLAESHTVDGGKLQREAHLKHHSHGFNELSSYKISLAGPLERERFIETIQSIPRSVFRIKGVVEFTDAHKPLLFQYVGGRFDLSEFNNPTLSDRFLILIGQNIRKESELIDW
jgi:G3E family GTPase